jgi:putative transposase
MVRELNKDSVAHGWDDRRWTLARIGRVIIENTGIGYAALDDIWRRPKQISRSWQASTSRSIEHDEEVISAWRTEV